MQALEQILDSLNPPQTEAVQTMDGPLLLLAGAGSGKTRVLTQRVANLIVSGRAAPDQILAVTFTNKAAREMEARICRVLADLGVPVRESLWVSTFHSICTRILRRHVELLDFKPFFSIYDDGDQLSQIKKVMNSLGISDKVSPAKSFRNRINTAKMLALSPKDLVKNNRLFLDAKSIEVYSLYEQEMKKANAMDFGDLLMKVHELFLMYPTILEQYQTQFRYIMVDEYQDTNHIQYLIVQALAKNSRNLCVVGDEDQSIYSWRGADIRNILDFEKDFPEAKIIKLEENYRSTGTIVTAATAVVKNNQERRDKTLFTNNPIGEPIQVREERNEYDEARFVAKTIQGLINDGTAVHSEFAVFYRTNAQSRVLEEQLRSSGIPYQLIGGVRFYERMEIKDLLSYMKLALNLADDMAFKRVVNTPTRGIGKTTIEKLEELSIAQKTSLLVTAQKAIETREFNAGTCGKLRRFVDLMLELNQLINHNSLLDFYQLVLEKTEYLQKLRLEGSTESDARIENLEELSNALDQFTKERGGATLQDFLEEMALVSDVDSMSESPDGVTLMTMHVSKGLEFPYVFIVGVEENLFPSLRSAEDEKESEMEEERRLCYVGMTRARQRLYLTHARSRKVWGQEQFNPGSRFLDEIPKDLVQVSSALEAPRFVSRMLSSVSMPHRPEVFPDYESASSNDYANDEIDGGLSYSKGMRVRHPTFGVGSIFAVEGSGEMQKVSVMFQDQTVKKFVAKYARLDRV